MRRFIPWIAIAIALIVSAVVYPRLPAMMPIHWGLTGKVDGWAPRQIGALILPMITIFLVLLVRLVRRAAAADGDDAPHVRASEITVAMVASFLVLVHLLVLAAALGFRIDMMRVVVFGLGAIFIALGPLLSSVPRNPWFGVRTPWTMKSDRVWERTHRVAGPLTVICGVVMGLASFFGPLWTAVAILVACLTMAVGTMGYSYVVWRQER